MTKEEESNLKFEILCLQIKKDWEDFKRNEITDTVLQLEREIEKKKRLLNE